jgi:hypothetical protein
VSNTITGIILLYLGGLEPINSLIRKITKPINVHETVIHGRVLDEQKSLEDRIGLDSVDVLIPDHNSGYTNKNGLFSLKIKYYKDDKDIYIKFRLKNYKDYNKELKITDLIDRDSIELKDIILTPKY